jgi:hypothetical protein
MSGIAEQRHINQLACVCAALVHARLGTACLTLGFNQPAVLPCVPSTAHTHTPVTPPCCTHTGCHRLCQGQPGVWPGQGVSRGWVGGHGQVSVRHTCWSQRSRHTRPNPLLPAYWCCCHHRPPLPATMPLSAHRGLPTRRAQPERCVVSCQLLAPKQCLQAWLSRFAAAAVLLCGREGWLLVCVSFRHSWRHV